MTPGQLDRRITLLQPVAEADPLFGTQETGWEVFASRIPAQVLDELPSKSESEEGGLRIAGRPARVRTRYLRGITSAMRVVVHGETDDVYEITGGPAEIGRREWTEFTIKAFSS